MKNKILFICLLALFQYFQEPFYSYNPTHKEYLYRGKEFWNTWRARNPNIIPDISDTGLGRPPAASKINISFMNLRKVNFSGSLLLGFFSENEIHKSDFQEADFKQSKISYCNIFNSNFKKAKIVAAFISRSNFYASNFSEAVFTKTRFFSIRFQECNLQNAIFNLSELDIVFINCDLKNASFNKISFSNFRNSVVFRDCILDKKWYEVFKNNPKIKLVNIKWV